MVPQPEPATPAQPSHALPPSEPPRHISRPVAHELNNILTIIQGYAEHMILKHADNLALRPELQLISDNVRRAVSVVRQASPRKSPDPTPVANAKL
jgi:signal transduction histidine kinase